MPADDAILFEQMLACAVIIIGRDADAETTCEAENIATACRNGLRRIGTAAPLMSVVTRPPCDAGMIAHAAAGALRPRPQLRVVRADPIDTCEA